MSRSLDVAITLFTRSIRRQFMLFQDHALLSLTRTDVVGDLGSGLVIH